MALTEFFDPELFMHVGFGTDAVLHFVKLLVFGKNFIENF